MKEQKNNLAINILMALTWSVALIAFLFIVNGCQKENPQPTAQTQPTTGVVVCNCGEITNINQYYPNAYFTYTVANECTGNDTIVNNSTYYDYGLNMCFEQQW